MEPAACLCKYVGEKDPRPYILDYVRGYAAHAELTDFEIEVLPQIVKLRVLETVVFFVARAAFGEDDIYQLTQRADNYAMRIRWINDNADVIRSSIREVMANAKADLFS